LCLIFHVFSVFSPQSMYSSVYFLYFTFFTVSSHISDPTVCLSHMHILQSFLTYSRSYAICVSFPTFFFSFLASIQVLQCVFLIFHVSVFLTIFLVLQCVLIILHDFHCFSRYFMSYHVSFPFSSFVSFLAIFQVLQCEFFFFLDGQFSWHIPGHTVFVSLFPRL
jgi:hypothetical protein